MDGVKLYRNDMLNIFLHLAFFIYVDICSVRTFILTTVSYSFVWLCCILSLHSPVNGHSPINGQLVSNFLLIQTRLQWSLLYMGRDVIRTWVIWISTSLDIDKLLSSVMVLVYPHSSSWEFQMLHILPDILDVETFNLANLMSVKWYPIVYFPLHLHRATNCIV